MQYINPRCAYEPSKGGDNSLLFFCATEYFGTFVSVLDIIWKQITFNLYFRKMFCSASYTMFPHSYNIYFVWHVVYNHFNPVHIHNLFSKIQYANLHTGLPIGLFACVKCNTLCQENQHLAILTNSTYSFPHSQQPTTDRYPQPTETSPHCCNLFL